MRARRTDAKHREVARAIKLLGLPFKDMSAGGRGVQDFLVGVRHRTVSSFWLLVEVKTPLNKTNDAIRESQFTPAQRQWYAQTEGLPRIVVTGFMDALEKLQEAMGITKGPA